MQIILLVIFLSSSVFANPIYQLNDKYRGGNNLIYDCQGLYYVCVKNEGRDNCAESREEALKLKLNKYPCVVLKSFSNKEDCLRKNYELLNSEATKRFCYSDGFHH
jgi:hypothetical protein